MAPNQPTWNSQQGLALRRWDLPPQQGDVIYSDCKSITDVINSATPQLSKFPANYHSCKPYSTTSKLSSHRASPWTGPKRTQSNVPPLTTTRTGIGASYLPSTQPPLTRSRTKSESNNISNSPSRKLSKSPWIPKHGTSTSPTVFHASPPRSSLNVTPRPSHTWPTSAPSRVSRYT